MLPAFLFPRHRRILLIALMLIGATASSLLAQEGASIYERSMRSVVTIEGANSRGSGFIVAPQVVATNYHVVSGLTKAVCFIDADGTRYTVDGYLAADEANDLALLKVSGLTERPLSFSTYDARPGQRIYVMGTPIGFEGTISEGLISSVRNLYGGKKLQISAPISHGSSGGPVMNVNGEVLGISCLGFESGENINFAIPVEYLKKMLARKLTNVHDLSTLPPMEDEQKSVSDTKDMGKAELIYDIGYADEGSILSFDYLVHFRDSTCLYFTYDMTDVSEADSVSEYWLADHRIIDIASGEVIKAIRSNLLGNEANPHRIYRGTKIYYSITFPRLAPAIRNFNLMAGNCEEGDYCFRNIRLRDYTTADGMKWRTYENPEPEGTVSFFSRSQKEKYTVILGNVNLGTLSAPWSEKSVNPNCGNTGNSVLTARLPIGSYKYKATCGDKNINGEVKVTQEGCVVVELGK